MVFEFHTLTTQRIIILDYCLQAFSSLNLVFIAPQYSGSAVCSHTDETSAVTLYSLSQITNHIIIIQFSTLSSFQRKKWMLVISSNVQIPALDNIPPRPNSVFIGRLNKKEIKEKSKKRKEEFINCPFILTTLKLVQVKNVVFRTSCCRCCCKYQQCLHL